MMIDVHCHLTLQFTDRNIPKFDDVDAVIKRAEKANVAAIINCGTSHEDNLKSLEIAKKYSIVKAALGCYPTYAETLDEEEFDRQLDFIKNNAKNIIAISEVGLDYKDPKTNKEKQKKYFQKIIELSEKIKKPLILHSRKAELDVVDMVESSSNKRIVMHCCEARKRIFDNGFFMSIPCTLVRMEHFQNIVKEYGLNQILTETDAPFLSPFKDRTNEPSFVIETIKKIAELTNKPKEEVEGIIYKNYQKLFK